MHYLQISCICQQFWFFDEFKTRKFVFHSITVFERIIAKEESFTNNSNVVSHFKIFANNCHSYLKHSSLTSAVDISQ